MKKAYYSVTLSPLRWIIPPFRAKHGDNWTFYIGPFIIAKCFHLP